MSDDAMRQRLMKYRTSLKACAVLMLLFGAAILGLMMFGIIDLSAILSGVLVDFGAAPVWLLAVSAVLVLCHIVVWIVALSRLLSAYAFGRDNCSNMLCGCLVYFWLGLCSRFICVIGCLHVCREIRAVLTELGTDEGEDEDGQEDESE